MAAASKNRKSDTMCADQDPPVIFQSPGLKPDIRLKVFNKEFHAHSVILKLYSAYFRKFLDSPEKKNYGSQTGLYRYDYISVVDYDGGWGMEPVALENQAINENALKEDFSECDEEEAFEMLLCAMYNRPYEIEHVAHLETLTRLADFYCALPIVSASMYRALWNSPKLISGISRWCFFTIKIAKKLHHAELFRESLVHAVGKWTGDSFQKKIFSDDKATLNAILLAHSSVYHLIMEANFAILKLPNINTQALSMIYGVSSPVGWRKMENPMEMAYSYRALLNKLKSYMPGGDGAIEAVETLLKNNLLLDRSPGAGEDGGSCQFLCAEVADEDLPWDRDQLDW